MTSFKPLLAATCKDVGNLSFPVLASPKLDGIRCVKLGGKALTRRLKPIPNNHVREFIERNLPDGVDGELMLRGQRSFEEVSSAIRSHDGEPDFVFHVFDFISVNGLGKDRCFSERLHILADLLEQISVPRVEVVPHLHVHTAEDLEAVIERHLEEGYEGTMVRDPQGRYKFGRSTVREGILLKIKSFVDEEATVTGIVELMRNQNELEQDELGHAKRSTKREGLVPAGTMGALQCRFEDGTEFEVGTGFTQEQRDEIWASAQSFIGASAKIKHQPPPGGRKPGQKPRFPVFLGWRFE